MRQHVVISDATPEPLIDESGFADFYARRLPESLRLAHLLTGSVAVGQEVTQEAFLAVHAKWAVIDNPDAYLRTTVLNLSRSVQRRQIRERRFVHTAPETVTSIAAYDETWHSVRHLPADQRAVVVLRFYADMSLSEIALALDRPIGTVKSTLHRALARLKETLHEHS